MTDAEKYNKELETVLQEADARDRRAIQLRNQDSINELVERGSRVGVKIADLIQMADQGYGYSSMEQYISSLEEGPDDDDAQ
jgi:hypothetical protein